MFSPLYFFFFAAFRRIAFHYSENLNKRPTILLNSTINIID